MFTLKHNSAGLRSDSTKRSNWERLAYWACMRRMVETPSTYTDPPTSEPEDWKWACLARKSRLLFAPWITRKASSHLDYCQRDTFCLADYHGNECKNILVDTNLFFSHHSCRQNLLLAGRSKPLRARLTPSEGCSLNRPHRVKHVHLPELSKVRAWGDDERSKQSVPDLADAIWSTATQWVGERHSESPVPPRWWPAFEVFGRGLPGWLGESQ